MCVVADLALLLCLHLCYVRQIEKSAKGDRAIEGFELVKLSDRALQG